MASWNDHNKQVIEEFRANGGKISGQVAGASMILITTKGAKSGLERTTPLVSTKDDDNLVIIASKGGAPTNPDWYHNLMANSEAIVELGAEKFPVRARVTEGEERQRLFDAQAALMPNFAEYQKKTTRQIPVLVLERAD